MAEPDLSRRGFLAGVGAVSVSLLFRRKLDRVLSELTAESASEIESAPAAADIVCRPQGFFRPVRLVVPAEVAPYFVIEDIVIGRASQLSGAGGVHADVFGPDAFDTAMLMDAAGPGTEISFRVRYTGDNPMGMPFTAALIGKDQAGRSMVMAIRSDRALVA